MPAMLPQAMTVCTDMGDPVHDSKTMPADKRKQVLDSSRAAMKKHHTSRMGKGSGNNKYVAMGSQPPGTGAQGTLGQGGERTE